MNVQKKYANLSFERQLSSGVLAEIGENFKGCTIKSKIGNSTHNDSNEQVDNMNHSEEQVDVRKWVRNNSRKQYDQIYYSNKQVDSIINDSDKQIDATSDCKTFLVTGSDPKSDPRSDPNEATHITNGNFAQKLLISRFVPKFIPVIIRPINPPITIDVMGIQDILISHQTMLPNFSVTDAVRIYAQMIFASASIIGKLQTLWIWGSCPTTQHIN